MGFIKINPSGSIIDLTNQEQDLNNNIYFIINDESMDENYIQLKITKEQVQNNIRFTCLFKTYRKIKKISISGNIYPFYENEVTIADSGTSASYTTQLFHFLNLNNNLNIYSVLQIYN